VNRFDIDAQANFFLSRLAQDINVLTSNSWNEIAHKAKESISTDLRDLMIGAENAQGQDLLQIIKSGEMSHEVDPRMYMDLKEVTEKYYLRVLVNSLWHFERAYIVDTDAENGKCHTDGRGPSESRVCLPEYPSHSYWLYSIDQSEEYDKFHDNNAFVHGPMGYRKFFEDSNFGLTKEDIVRSSLFMDANNFEDQIRSD
jgi:hypothetical protein